jgi:hypothetical protein
MDAKLKALLAPKTSVVELGEDVKVVIKELSLRERINWRVECINENGDLKPDWMAHLLHVAVLQESGAKVWDKPEEVDGSEAVLADLLKKVQEVNKMTSDAVEEASGN